MLWQGGVHKADGSACCDKTAASCKVGSTLPRTTPHAFETGAYWLASYTLRVYRNGTPTRVTTGDVACVCVCIYSCSVRARVCVCSCERRRLDTLPNSPNPPPLPPLSPPVPRSKPRRRTASSTRMPPTTARSSPTASRRSSTSTTRSTSRSAPSRPRRARAGPAPSTALSTTARSRTPSRWGRAPRTSGRRR